MPRGALRRLFSPAVILAATTIGGLLVSPALSAPGGVPDAQTKGLRSLRVIGFVQYPPLVAAQEFGYMAAEGLDVSVDITPSSTFQMQGLTRGDWDLALADSTGCNPS